MSLITLGLLRLKRNCIAQVTSRIIISELRRLTLGHRTDIVWYHHTTTDHNLCEIFPKAECVVDVIDCWWYTLDVWILFTLKIWIKMQYYFFPLLFQVNIFILMFFIQEQKICQRYDQLMEAWEKKVERMENNPRRKAKESRTREYYERQFPEIRKQREQQERFQRYHALYPSLVRILLLICYNTLYVFLCWSLAPHTCSTWYISVFFRAFFV